MECIGNRSSGAILLLLCKQYNLKGSGVTQFTTGKTSQGSASQKVAVPETVVGLASALLAQQLPPLPKFSGGEQSQEEPFKEWIAQFEFEYEF